MPSLADRQLAEPCSPGRGALRGLPCLNCARDGLLCHDYVDDGDSCSHCKRMDYHCNELPDTPTQDAGKDLTAAIVCKIESWRIRAIIRKIRKLLDDHESQEEERAEEQARLKDQRKKRKRRVTSNISYKESSDLSQASYSEYGTPDEDQYEGERADMDKTETDKENRDLNRNKKGKGKNNKRMKKTEDEEEVEAGRGIGSSWPDMDMDEGISLPGSLTALDSSPVNVVEARRARILGHLSKSAERARESRDLIGDAVERGLESLNSFRKAKDLWSH